MSWTTAVLLVALCASAIATVIDTRRCSGTYDKCSVTEVRVTPCARSSQCIVKQGTNITLSFDFTPQFAATQLQTLAYSRGIPFAGQETNACLFTTCPAVSGQSQTLNYELAITSKIPAGLHPFEWKVWNVDNELGEVCCFSTSIRIKRNKKQK
ncbi:MD-2-related lipid-recognition protein-like [Anticarsia gemmatalis]|uniref:MD-2-related lipid-recognition protein-like n=1 Tax=Anticarsia gemmatalis TaxID=129554 RepID=UPI003F77726F